MVKHVTTPSFEEVTFYPLDTYDNPPPEIVIKKDGEQDNNSNFRISQIVKYNEFLSSEIRRRENTVEKFKNLDWICFVLEMLFVITDIILGSLGLLFPDWISSTSSICILLTTISTFIRGMMKKFMTKLEKHQALLFVTKSKFVQAKDQYELAIRDGEISHEEYLVIVDEYRKYEKLRQEILSKYSPL